MNPRAVRPTSIGAVLALLALASGCSGGEPATSVPIDNTVSAEETVRQIMTRMEHHDVQAVGEVMTARARKTGMYPPRVTSFELGSTLHVGREQAVHRGRQFRREDDVSVSYDPVSGDHDDYYEGSYDTFILVVDDEGRWFLDERGGKG